MKYEFTVYNFQTGEHAEISARVPMLPHLIRLKGFGLRYQVNSLAETLNLGKRRFKTGRTSDVAHYRFEQGCVNVRKVRN